MSTPNKFSTPAALVVVAALVAAGCGDATLSPDAMEGAPMNQQNGGDWAEGNDDSGGGGEPGETDDDFEPEEEEFLVQQVAATDSYVFVPNQSEDSDTVALIDGRDFSVRPMRVGRQPTEVVAADVDGEGAVAYVLSTGQPTVAIVRADADGDGEAAVNLLPVPWEVNKLALSPDGRHVLAYIDPDEPLNEASSTASLQTMALIRLGEPGEADEVFQLSVTRQIDNIAFSADGTQAFVVGQEGINYLPLEDIKADAFLPAIDLGMAPDEFSPQDREVAFSADGSVMAMRTSQYEGVGIFEFDSDEGAIADHRLIDLDGIPSDLGLFEADDGQLRAVVTVRDTSQVVLFDVEQALAAADDDVSFLEVLDASGADAGIGRLSPDESKLAVFSTLPLMPMVGLVDLETGELNSYEMRNQIRSLALSPDSQTAVVVHRAQAGPPPTNDPEDQFRHRPGITLWDLESGYRRPLGLRGEPEDILMTTDGEGHPYLFVMLTADNRADEGVLRVDLVSHRTDFTRLPRRPMQLGAVAEQIFVSQEEEMGRITFFDVADNEQRTVSGYELNAGIR